MVKIIFVFLFSYHHFHMQMMISYIGQILDLLMK